MSADLENLPPTEQLCLEVLAARYRLGEKIWTFSTKNTKALESLAARGYVRTLHGNVERTIRASLTDEGIKEAIDPNYVPRLFRENREVDRLRGWLSWVGVTTDHESAYYALHGYEAPTKDMIEKERDLPENLHPAEIKSFCEARQERLDEYKRLLGCLWLYLNWRYVTKQLTTEQKELFANAVDFWSKELNEDDLEGWQPVAERWWRD